MSKETTVTPAQVQDTIQQVYNFYKEHKKELKENYNEVDKSKFTFEMFLFAAASNEHGKVYLERGLNEEHQIFDKCCITTYNYLKENYAAIIRSKPKGKHTTEHVFGYLFHSLTQYITNE